MTNETTIQPINVAAATFLVQLLFLAILGLTARFRGRLPDPGRSDEQSPPLMLLSVVSFAILALASDFYDIWSPLFPGVGIATVKTSTAVFLVQLMNLATVTYLMIRTGCSANSPYTSALFTIPALAIFLRLPPWIFFTLAGLSIVIYLWLFAPNIAWTWGHVAPNRGATAFMNIGCLLLATLTGYVTRPIPITDLETTPSSSVGKASPVNKPSLAVSSPPP